jgi:hypothetical protein
LECALLLTVLQKGTPKLRYLWLEARQGKVVDLASNDLFPGKSQQLTRARAGVSGIAVVVGDEERRGRVVDNRPEEEFQFFRPVLYEPIGGW